MRKRIFTGIAILVLAIVCYGVYKLATFSLFDNDSVLIEEIQLNNKDYKIKIIFYPSDATMESSMQVIKVLDDNKEVIVLGDYESYNFLESYEINNDSLFIIVNDTLRRRVKAKKFGIKLP